MAFQEALQHLKIFGLDNRVKEFDESTATVEEAAKAVGCTEREIGKTMSFKDKNNNAFLIVIAGDGRIDNRKFKDEFKMKATMLSPEEVETMVGHSIGGVCPFGINPKVDVYFDTSIKDHEYIYPACGSTNSCVKLTPEEMKMASRFKGWVTITKERT
ncbi:MAG: YbaK/EbsC family protein [Tissierellia bacterium]|nr:YbaK/EbsC family protein [Tissierellia bacterium]